MSIATDIEVELYADIYSRSSDTNVDTSHIPELAKKITKVVTDRLLESLGKY